MPTLPLMTELKLIIWGACIHKMSDLLKIQQLSIGYDAPNILTHVDLNVRAGDCIALIGQNGVGKSTLLRAIMGLTPKISGSMIFDGQSLSDKKPYEIARLGIGFVPQENAVFADLTVAEHFALQSGGQRGVKRGVKDRAEQQLRYFPDLLPKIKQQAKKLSGGQRQQLAVALALAQQPKLLLLDEPGANIQPSVVESMVKTLKQINEQTHVTLIVAEQNLSVISHLANKAYLIKAGQLINQPINVGYGKTAELAADLKQLERAS